ncbi:MAG: VanW family protein [Armatimonadota bacterium]|nr:VanW family protein [Armatimonadota bacterium]MDR7562136.1 VanW family protein [Armatimonadota bacterium]MDR7567523.1 VanW family protein [Armatimonadota bacterium]MDR7602464.1 VanW family protein [Armatimonadota bacterium]
MQARYGGVLLLVAALTLPVAYTAQELHFAGRILPGVWVEDVPVGGKAVGDAVVLLRDRTGARFRRPISVRAFLPGQTRVWRRTPRELGFTPDLASAVREAYAVGRTGSLLDRVRTRWRLWQEPVVLRLPIRRRPQRLEAFLREAARAIYRPPRDARFWVDERGIRLLPSQDGVALDEAAARQQLVRAVLEGREGVDLPLREIRPPLTTDGAAALGIREVVAEFRTRLMPDPDRTHNILLTARLLRGRVLRTGEIFSFNEAVGPRTQARGFRPAPVILHEEFVPGDGGGVCQVSSTLFNAALLADLTILHRTNHSLPVSYLPLGRDATVIYGVVDLRFRNDGPPLLLWSEVRGRELVVRFYGRRPPGRQVDIVVTDVVRVPPPAGQVVRVDPGLPMGVVKILPPRPGFRAITWRIVREGDRVVRREVVARSFYRPVPATVKMGTRSLATAPRSP